ncbi:uncharacterized protein [Physcomitrium patens]|uniref:uncharacterized protein isoform X1 n=1 Tax=Physcomitrium patens TaxID=3218 RepID=UPI000D16A8D2|nr:uncharacterized protein LOC112286875 isoform X1 [Physcomitrium patens]|eukprot:XP_024384987.1 uncharacterized protein LOC112286875 isoform X1 [Physcomitrella patens]
MPHLRSEYADITMPSPEFSLRDKKCLHHSALQHVGCDFIQAESATPLVASRTRPLKKVSSTDSPVSLGKPPPVPKSIPRDPVPQGGRGAGWPYAPQGWPKSDDKWGWRVGKRVDGNSLWIDRHIMLPMSLLKGRKPGKPVEFASRKRLLEYFKQNFPQIGPDSICKAFDWKIPALKGTEIKEATNKRGWTTNRDKPPSLYEDDGCQKLKKRCRAGNPDCLLEQGKGDVPKPLQNLACRICCSEPSFCRECKCILCCGSFLADADGISIIRCLNSPVSGHGICGHASHLECALNSQLAGSIKKSGLDMEYMCRRCDRKTDLRRTFSRLIGVMNKTATQSKVENSLQLALRIVQDPEDISSRPGKILATCAGDALRKELLGVDVGEIYKVLTQQLLWLRSGQGVYGSQVSHQVLNWSGAMRRKFSPEDSLHPTEISLDKFLSQSKSKDSHDAPGTLSNPTSHPHVQGMADVSAQQDGSNDVLSLVKMPINALSVLQGNPEADGIAITSGLMVQHVVNADKELPGTSFQSPPKLEDRIIFKAASQTSHVLLHTPELSIVINQCVSKPPTLTIEEHIRQCEAMADRMKGASKLDSPLNLLPVATPRILEVVLNSEPPTLTTDSLTTRIHDELVPASQDVVPSAEDLHRIGSFSCAAAMEVTSIPCNVSRESPSVSDSQDADRDNAANTGIMEVSMTQPPKISSCVPVLDLPHAEGLEAEYENQIAQALEKLRKALEAEYACAEKSLHAQKRIIIEKYRQLGNMCGDVAKSGRVQVSPDQFVKDLSKSRAQIDRDINRLVDQFGKAQEEQRIFESMLAISNGFGQASNEFLREFFNWPLKGSNEV